MGVAAVLSLGQFATQYAALDHGQGRSTEYLTTSPDLSLLNSIHRASVILFFLALYTAKGSAIALLYRFAPSRRHKLTVAISFGFILILGVVSVLVLNVSCGLTGTLYWHIAGDSAHCPNQYTRWKVTTAFDIVSEVLILLVPVNVIWSLQMKTSTKLGVLGRFSVRLPVLALAIGRFFYVRNLLLADDVGIASDKTIIMQEVQMAASLAAPVIVTLRPFTKDFNTGFGQGGGVIAAYGMSNAGGTDAATQRSGGFGSKIASRLGLNSTDGDSRNDTRKDIYDLKDLRRKDLKLSAGERSESVKGLTDEDVITQTIDYEVHYENIPYPSVEDKSTSSQSRERW